MNKQNIILNFEDILNTYKTKIPKKKYISLISRRWLPLKQNSNLTQESAYFLSKIMGDGNLDKSFTCRFIGDFKDLRSLKKLIIQNYSIKSKSMTIRSKKARGHSHMLQVNDSLFGRFLYSLGAPKGNKTKIKFLVPNWIICSKNNKKYFLQGLFDDELSTIKIKRKKFIQEATFRMAKIEKYQKNLREFLSQIKKFTEDFNVNCSKIDKPHFESIQKDGSRSFSQCFRILGNINNIIHFNKNIGFRINNLRIKELKKSIFYVKKMRGRGFEPR
ncbi:hypothetical protein ISS04_04185 [Candidatus Woesearchaeota archaeon]|nr:hypothetical protein [Candidatus Woesearchaeota archaeon]